MIIDSMRQELDQEAETTRRVLARVPDDRLSWRPHPKARTLGALAMHVATTPGGVARLAATSPAQAPNFESLERSPDRAAELVPALEQSVSDAQAVLRGLDDAALAATWRLMRGDREILAIPRGAFLRAIMLNHWYHHRGQLTAYLRELDVKVPSVYGPSADENPFG
jgi:uncharacterized damage-inducible protein DinB